MKALQANMGIKAIFNSLKQWHIYANISQKLKINVNKPRNKQPRKLLRIACIIMTPGKKLLYFTQLPFKRQFTIFYQNWIWRESFQLCILLTLIFQRKDFELLLSEKELNKVPDDRPDIFKESNIDRYIKRPSATFCNGK